MIFNTWSFALFMCLVCAGFWISPSGRWRQGFLAASGVFFFGYAYPPFLPLLLAVTLLTWWAAREAGRGRWMVALAGCVGVLAWFKYRHFFGAMAGGDWEAAYSKKIPMGLVPLGISFFTFEFVHYLVDVRMGRAAAGRLGPYMTFIFFFPSMVSGPIKRWQFFEAQRQQALAAGDVPWTEAGWRIAQGLFKKLVLADTFALLAKALADPAAASAGDLWKATFAYAVQILFDFSGYSDIAIGCGLLLGYRLPENFNFPYGRRNISEFWRNWHMSLSSWIRDYLFIPLGGSRTSRGRVIFNLAFVMAVCGLWHGAGLNFVAWGLWHGAGLVAWHAFRTWRGGRAPWPGAMVWDGLSRVATFLFVCVGWVFFAAPSLQAAFVALSKMGGLR